MVVREIERAATALGFAGGRVLVAVSGGVDSTVLAHALAAFAPRSGFSVAIGHVNHGLRGAESDADERAVSELARGLGLPFASAAIAPREARNGGSSRDRPTLQEAARALRYQALYGLARRFDAARIATGHNADDQAETVLLRIFRGTGPDGLTGIPERSPDGVVVRPLLRVARGEIEAYALAHGLKWREDASNEDVAYTRNRLRHSWIPGLRDEFNPQLLRVVADLAEAQRRDSEWIQSLVEREAELRLSHEGKWLQIDGNDWGAMPVALQRRLARLALQRCGAGRQASRVHLQRICDFLSSGRVGSWIEIPGGLRLERGASGWSLGPLPAPPASGLPVTDPC